MRTPLIAGNWKMHKTLADARALVSGLVEGVGSAPGVDVLICPPVQLLFPMAKAVAGTPIMLGGQNAHEAIEGAYTGEVSAPMLIDTGCKYVILGHSERRHIYGEGGELLAEKVKAAITAGLTVVYCIGETLDEREAGQTRAVVERQIRESLGSETTVERLVIAYEPVWAIGTGRTATPEQAQQVHGFLRSMLAEVFGADSAAGLRILYGGSVKPGNAADLMSQEDVDGALVGGACLVADDFLAIIRAAAATVSPAAT